MTNSYRFYGTGSATGYLTEEGITAYVEIYSPYTPPEDTPYPNVKQINYGNQAPVNIVVSVFLDSEIEALPEFTLKLIVQGTAERWNLDGSNATTADFHVNPGRSENPHTLAEYYVADGSVAELREYTTLTGGEGELWYITFKPDAFKLMTPDEIRIDIVTIPLYSNGSKELTEAEQAEGAEPKYLAIRPVPLEDIGNALPIYWDNDATQLLLFMASVGADGTDKAYLFKVLFAGGKLQGFGVENEVDLGLAGYSPLGITNTGDGYVGALRKGLTYEYMFISEVNGITPLLFANTDYIRNAIPTHLTPQWRGMSLYFDDQIGIGTPIPNAPSTANSPSHWNLSGSVNPVWSQPGFPSSFGYRLTPITQFILSGGASGGQVGGYPYAFSKNKTIPVPSILANDNPSLHCRFTSITSDSNHDTYITNNSYTGRHSRLNSGIWGLFTTITNITVNTIGEAKVGKQQQDGSYTEPSSNITSNIVYSVTHYNNQTFKRQFMFAGKDGKTSVEFEYPMFSEHSSNWNIDYTPTSVTETMWGSGNTNRTFSTTIPLYTNGNIPLKDIYQYFQSHTQNATHSWTTGTTDYNSKRYLTTFLQPSTMTADMSSTLLIDSVIPRLLLQGDNCALVELTIANQTGTEKEYDSTPLSPFSPTTQYEKINVSTQDIRQPSITLLVMVKGINYEITYDNCKSFFFTNYGWPEYHNTIGQQLDGLEPGTLSTPIDVSLGEWEFYPVFGTTESYTTYYKLMNQQKQVRYHPEGNGSTNVWSFVENVNPFWVNPSYKVGAELHIVVATETKTYHCKGVLTSEGLNYSDSYVYTTDFCQFQITEYLDNAPYFLSAEQYTGIYVSSADDFTSFMLSSFVNLINSTKTYNLYTVTDAQGNETVELAIASKNIKINDNFIDAIELTGQNVSVRGNNTTATAEEGEPPAEGTLNSLWYKWTAPSNQKVFIHCRPTGETGAFLSTIYTEGLSEAVPRAEDESITPVSGTTYYIQCDGGNNWVGEFILAISTVSVFDQPQPVLEIDSIGYADVYWFDTAALAWKRKGAVSSPVSRLEGAAEYISYHPGVVEEGG